MSDMSVLVSGNAASPAKGGTISKDEQTNAESTAMDFAAILGGWLVQVMGQGQDSGFQSGDPAGKEANSGQTCFQGLGDMLGSLRTIAGLNLESGSRQGLPGFDATLTDANQSEIMQPLSPKNLLGGVPDSGIESGQLQGEISPVAELDQYRVWITQLLQDMSGEIRDVSVNTNDIKDLLAQINQELKTLLPEDLVAKTKDTLIEKAIDNPLVNSGMGLQNSGGHDGLSLAQGVKTNESQTIIQSPIQERNQTLNDLSAPIRNSEFDGFLPGNRLLQMNMRTETGTEIGQSGHESANSKNAGTEDPNFLTGNLSLNNFTLPTIAEAGNKTDASPNLPVWVQVAQTLRDTVLHPLPVVRELMIQLHPAELGQIHISLAWDNGQVHLQLQASEAATGQLIQNHIPQLRETLTQSGVSCGMMQMGFSDSQSNFNQGRNWTFSSSTNHQEKQESDSLIKQDETSSAVSVINRQSQGLGQSSRINVMA